MDITYQEKRGLMNQFVDLALIINGYSNLYEEGHRGYVEDQYFIMREKLDSMGMVLSTLNIDHDWRMDGSSSLMKVTDIRLDHEWKEISNG